jgi:hypothetical protein
MCHKFVVGAVSVRVETEVHYSKSERIFHKVDLQGMNGLKGTHFGLLPNRPGKSFQFLN